MTEVSMNRAFRCCNKAKPAYNKLNTGGNDPSISKAHRLSQYLKNVKPTTQYSDIQVYLDNKGLIYVPVTYTLPNFKSSHIDNNIVFTREKIFL
jgi:hypothetical protein